MNPFLSGVGVPRLPEEFPFYQMPLTDAQRRTRDTALLGDGRRRRRGILAEIPNGPNLGNGGNKLIDHGISMQGLV